jgi:hypothetical protein
VPGQSGTIPLPAIRTKETLMTSIHTYDPASAGAALPELPPLPIGVLAVAAADLLQWAADLPQPRYITIHATQAIRVQFVSEQASVRAVAQWARRFGGVVVIEPIEAEDGPKMYHRTEFDYYGIAVTAYAVIPAGPAAT